MVITEWAALFSICIALLSFCAVLVTVWTTQRSLDRKAEQGTLDARVEAFDQCKQRLTFAENRIWELEKGEKKRLELIADQSQEIAKQARTISEQAEEIRKLKGATL